MTMTMTTMMMMMIAKMVRCKGRSLASRLDITDKVRPADMADMANS